MSVNAVFGQNLRQLALERGSLSRAADQLGISRVQFQRYLKGESFPKPSQLQAICAHFGVDARILLEPLPTSLDAMRALQLRPTPHPIDPLSLPLPEQEPTHELDGVLARVFGWALRGNSYAIAPDIMPDGLYNIYVADGARQDVYHWMLTQISSTLGPKGERLSTSRTFRAYFGRWYFPRRGPEEVFKRQREVRGAVLGVPDGIVLLAFNPAPVYRISMVHLAPIADGSFIGFISWGRAELAGFARVARLYMEPVGLPFFDTIKRARMRQSLSPKDVPQHVLRHIDKPVEWRPPPFSA
jgi:transcriptional regulator with XRE-family HTH domain